MQKIILLFSTILFFAMGAISQIYLEPFAGGQFDMNNHSRFKQLNTGVQVSFKTSRRYEIMLQLTRSWAVPVSSSHDSSFSLNPSLPLYSPASKKLSPSVWTVAGGNRIGIFGVDTKNIVSLVVYAGLTFQKVAVDYTYDKSNYTLLNPDRTLTAGGPFISGGAEYMHLFNNSRIFIQMNFSTPPARKNIDYPSSFGFMAPLSFNAGYSFPIKKSNHEK